MSGDRYTSMSNENVSRKFAERGFVNEGYTMNEKRQMLRNNDKEFGRDIVYNDVPSGFPELYAQARAAKNAGNIEKVRTILDQIQTQIDTYNEGVTKQEIEDEFINTTFELLGNVNSTSGGRRSKKSRKHRKSRKAGRKGRKTRRR